VQLGADIDCIGRVDRAVTFLDVLDFSFFVHYKRGAVRELELIVQDAVLLRHLPRHVAKQREFHSDFFGERLIGRGSVDADPKYGGVFSVDLSGVDTSLVCLEFFRSTAGESKDIKRQ
jgi:hypothetical protein